MCDRGKKYRIAYERRDCKELLLHDGCCERNFKDTIGRNGWAAI